MPETYTNGELALLIIALKDSFEGFKEVNKSDHESLKCAQAYTNGTVKKHVITLSYLKGAWAVVSLILVGLIIPLTLNYFQTKNTVEQQVEKALSVYLEKQ